MGLFTDVRWIKRKKYLATGVATKRNRGKIIKISHEMKEFELHSEAWRYLAVKGKKASIVQG